MSNIDNIRKMIRMNRINHLKFKPIIGSMEGQKYFSSVYKPNQSVYCTVDPKDERKKERVCGYTRPPNKKNPAEIDLLPKLDVSGKPMGAPSINLNSALNSSEASELASGGYSSNVKTRYDGKDLKVGNHIKVLENSTHSDGILSEQRHSAERSKRNYAVSSIDSASHLGAADKIRVNDSRDSRSIRP